MNTLTRCSVALGAVVLTVAFAAVAAGMMMGPPAKVKDGVVSIELPPPNKNFNDGPGMTVTRKSCTQCHASDYIYMQPPLSRAQWEGEVNKMRKTYNGDIKEKDIATIVDFLMTQNGAK